MSAIGVDTLRLSAEDALALIDRGEVTSRELWDAYRTAIDEAMRSYTRPDPRRQARRRRRADRDQGRDLHEGIRTTAGSRTSATTSRSSTPTVAARCRAASMPVLGKTNTDEFAMGSSTENSAYGPTHNPWDRTRAPGGSGGGSAAAVSAGFAPWSLGSDTGGSIKLPSAFCGNVGLRPDLRHRLALRRRRLRVEPRPGRPVSRNVRDNAPLYRIISGLDEHDSTTVDVPPVVLPEGDDLKGVRIGVPKQLNEVEGIEPGVKASVEAALEQARALGAELGDCELPLSVDYGLAATT